jgi:hypothetical protein
MQHKAQPTAMGTRPKTKQTKRKLDADPVQAVQAVPVKEEAAEKEDNNQAVQAVPVKEEAAEKEDNNQAVQAVPVKEEAAEKEDNNEKSRRRQEEEIPKEEEAAEKEDKNESTQPSSLTILASCCFVHLGLNGQTLISISWKGMFVWIDVARCREPDKHI